MTLRIELDDPLCEVGAAFTGRVLREPDADGVSTTSRARAVRLVLRMWTEGRGDKHTREVCTRSFDLQDHGGLTSAFSLSVPRSAPVSYDGSLIRVRYEIEGRVDVRLARDPKIKRPVLVVPEGGLGIYDRPHPLPRT